MPETYQGRAETSVFRTGELTADQIFPLAAEVGRKDLAVKARGDITVSKVEDVRLRVEAETTQHRLHALILGWPEDVVLRRQMALELSDQATTVVP